MDWNLVGHDWAVKMLKQHIESGQTRHAYLFAGPMGIGRRTLALRFAQAINCQSVSEDLEPCGECRICRQFERMQHPDMAIVDCVEDSQSIKVDQIRELQRTVSLTPIEANYRIALLLDFQNATESAQNALLKTLEEPPTQVILLMTVDSIDHLLPTIISRCEILRMRTMPVDKLTDHLVQNFPVAQDEALIFSSASGGRIGEAISLIASPEKAQNRKQWIDALLEMIGADRIDRMKYAEKHFRYGRETLQQAFQVWLTFWRDVLMLALEGESTKLVHIDYRDQMENLNTWLTVKEILEQISNLNDYQVKLEANANVLLLAEVMLLGLPRDE
jgi:DNA polymerase-3 subunit delta'